MLVLSRREDDKIVFPSIGVTIHIVRLKGNTARIGIDAPRELRILRHEIAHDYIERDADVSATPPHDPASDRHAVRNALNACGVAIHLLRRQLENGMVEAAAETLEKMARHLGPLDSLLHSETPSTPQQPERLQRALLVEDDVNESELLAGFMRMQGFDVSTAADGEDAVDFLASHQRPDVVLMDMMMPRCDGPTAIETIRGNPRYEGLKIFALSGTRPNSLGVAMGPRGVNRWFQKPINPEILVREISKELGRGVSVN